MLSMKKMLTVLAFLGTLLVAPLASADRYRGVDGRWYETDRHSRYYHDDRRDRRRHYRRSSRNRDVAVAAAILGTAAIIASNSDRRHHRRHRSYRGYGSWRNYCRHNWRRDPRC